MAGLTKVVLALFSVGGQAAKFDCASYVSTCKDTAKYQAYGMCDSTAVVNSVTNATGMACRSTHLALVNKSDAASAVLHCPHAAPDATAPCAVEKLKAFDCSLYTSTCSGVAGYQAYSNCASTVAVNGVNGMACRIQHLAAATKDAAAALLHCPHAAPDATAPCAAEKLKAFDCALYASTCKDATGYEAYNDCANTILANGANGMACRTHHLAMVAKPNASKMHCSHLQFNAKGPCASQTLKTFDGALYTKTCQNVTNYTAYVNVAGVVAANMGGMQCRIYHLSVAATSVANAAIHCKHAAPKAEAPCATETLKAATAATGTGAASTSAGFEGAVPKFCLWALILAFVSAHA